MLGPLDLTLDMPGITVVMGPNGAGKTTLLRALHGLDKLHAGTVVSAQPTFLARRQQAFVFQTPILLRRSVEANLRYPLLVRKMSRLTIDKAVETGAEQVGLTHALNRPAHLLSAGERQKLALARALITSPELLFLDEPCANLDGRTIRDIEDLLRRSKDQGMQLLLATHDMGQARRLATNVIFLLNGRIHETGPAISVLADPKTEELSAFLKGEIVE